VATVDSRDVSRSSIAVATLFSRAVTVARRDSPLAVSLLVVADSELFREAIFSSKAGKRRFVIWPWLLFVVEWRSSMRLLIVDECFRSGPAEFCTIFSWESI
jgi:hypothetical protein